MKVGVIADAQGVPIQTVTDAADAAETTLCAVMADQVQQHLDVPKNTPLVYDRGCDSDPLREQLDDAGIRLIVPHRSNRKKPKTTDGRSLRRYKRRYRIERTISWFHSFRRITTRYEKTLLHYDCFVKLSMVCLLLGKMVL